MSNYELLRSQAEVSTPRGERWIKQLASHLSSGAKTRSDAELLQDAHSTTLLLAGGTCSMTSDATALRFVATGPDEATLIFLQELITSHLERFSAKEDLRVVWRREQGTPSSLTTGRPRLPLDPLRADLHQ